MRKMVNMEALKERLFSLLEKDVEFRLAVAGMLGFRDIMDRLEKHDRKFNEILEELRKHRKILEEHSTILHRYITTMEEEAHEVIAYRLREKGISVELSTLVLPDLEVNVYGATDDTCIVGETAVRLGRRKIEELEEKMELLREKYPKFIRPRTILVLYTMRATDEAIRRAKEEGIWLLTATKELVSLSS